MGGGGHFYSKNLTARNKPQEQSPFRPQKKPFVWDRTPRVACQGRVHLKRGEKGDPSIAPIVPKTLTGRQGFGGMPYITFQYHNITSAGLVDREFVYI